MTTFIEYLQYPFFLRALIVGGFLSLILSWMSGYTVLRQEVLFTDALSNIGFLGIALAILFNLPITLMLIVVCLIAAYLIHVVQRGKLFQNDSLLEIFSRVGLALGIIVVGLFPGYRINIEQFLFGDILGISSFDFWLTIVLLFGIGLVVLFSHRTFLKISLSDTLSHSLVKYKKFWHGLLIFLLAIMIALSMKIIGVLLVAAFTTIPSNTAKIFAKNISQTFILSSLLGIVATFAGLYLSVLFNLPSGALIVVVLGGFWVVGILYSRNF
ncbi:metal ABC transporter permease [Candidatus Peregrinibacteria bacterium]|nr:metal ABC transporter permease [Candidatus Peregrinibacteria bacterium]